jgi:hypothetical protein
MGEGGQNWGVYMIVFGERMHNCSRDGKKRWFHECRKCSKRKKKQAKKAATQVGIRRMRKVFMPKAIYVLYGCKCIITFPSTGDPMTKGESIKTQYHSGLSHYNTDGGTRASATGEVQAHR